MLGRLDEGAGDVHILDEPHFQGNAARCRIADGGGESRFGNAGDQVGVGRVFLPEQTAGILPEGIGAAAFEYAVRPGEVNIFHGAETALAGGRMPEAVQAVAVHAHQFPGLDVPQETGSEFAEGAGLAGDYVAVPERPDGERAETVAVPAGIDGLRAQDDGGVGAVQDIGGGKDARRAVFLRRHAPDEVTEKFAVRCGEEEVSFRLQATAQDLRVDDIAVVGHGEGSAPVRHLEGLDVLQAADGRGRITHMADAGGAGQGIRPSAPEDVPDEARTLMDADHPVRPGGGDAATLLPPVLEALEGDAGLPGRAVHAEQGDYAALLVQLLVWQVNVHAGNAVSYPWPPPSVPGR